MLKNLEISRIKKFIVSYKSVNLKPIHSCSLEELYERDSNCKLLTRSFIISSILVLVFLMYETVIEGLELWGLLAFFLLIVMGYDEGRKRENIQLFIHFKKNNNGDINYG